MERTLDWLKIETDFVAMQANSKRVDAQHRSEQLLVEKLRETPTRTAYVVEIFNDCHNVIVTLSGGRREWYIPVLSIVDKDMICVNAVVLCRCTGPYLVCCCCCSFLRIKTLAIIFQNVATAVVGVLPFSLESSATTHRLDRAPPETFDDIGGLEDQIREIKESVELPLTRPELYEEMGIQAPKGVILYGEPGTGKTLLAKAVANSTSATFMRACGSDLVQKHGGEGARLVRDLFKLARDSAPCIIFLDEIDVVGTKRYDTTSRGEQEVQRTMLELLNQLDGFDSRGDVKIIMATNRIDSLDPALIRPGRIDRKIELPKPDERAKLKIFDIHTNGMTLAKDVESTKLVAHPQVSGADIKAMCADAGMIALRDKRRCVCQNDFVRALDKIESTKKERHSDTFYV